MKKYIYFVFSMLVFLLFGLLIYKLLVSDKEKLTPAERYREENENTNNESNVIKIDNYRLELISCEIIDDSELSGKGEYKQEHYHDGVIPEYPCYDIVFNQEEAASESQELRDYWDNPEAYTMEEAGIILEKYDYVFDKYSEKIYEDRKYIFVKCKIINDNEKPIDIYLNSIDTVVSTIDKSISEDGRDSIIYFDKSIHTEGEDREHRFYCIRLEGGETLDCTLGFVIEDIGDNVEYFIGEIEEEFFLSGENYSLSPNLINMTKLFDLYK